MRLIIIIGILFTLLDQLLKYIISNVLMLGESVQIIQSFFHFTYVQNTGAAWSILEGSRILLILISFVAIGLVYFFMIKDKKIENIEKVGYGILLGGIFGNLIDRVVHGYVIDFLHFTFGNYQFPVFNVADMGIVIGTFIIIFIMLKEDLHGNNSGN